MATIKKVGNSYRIRVSCGYDLNHKQIVRSMNWRPDSSMTPKQIEREVKRQAERFESECKNFTNPSQKPVKFQVLGEDWFKHYAEHHHKSTTLTFERHLSERTYKAIGHIRVDKITTQTIQSFINSLTKDGENLNTKKCLSAKTLRHYCSFVSNILEYGIKCGMLNKNPCRSVSLPHREKQEKKIYTIDELQECIKLLVECEHSKYKVFFLLAIYTGMRRGELLGLEWKDFDFNEGSITISRTSNYTKSKGIYTSTTKTQGSNRTVLFNKDVIPFLQEYKQEQDAQKQAMGDKWVDTDRLFVGENGKPLNVNAPYEWLERFCKKHKLPFYGVHSFRHLYASISIGLGTDIITISKSMGHSQRSTTLDIYGHQIGNNQFKARVKLDSYIPLPDIKSQKSG